MGLAVLALAAGAAWAGEEAKENGKPGGAPMGPPPAVVRTAPVRVEKTHERWDVTGRLQEVRRATVTAEQSGRVVEMKAEEGDAVEGGKTALVRVDDVWMKLALATAESRLAEAEAAVLESAAKLAKSKRDLQYLEELGKTSSARPKEIDDARADVDVNAAKVEQSRSAVNSAKTAVSLAKENLGRLAVIAPFDGVVVRKLTEIGQWVAPGTPVAEIITRGRIDALVAVPEKIVNTIKPGQDVEVVIEPLGKIAVGKIESINPMGMNAARSFPVKIRLDDQKGELKAGMSVTARIPTNTITDHVIVPRDAVIQSANGPAVWTSLDGKAMPVGVTVLFGVENGVAVKPSPAGPPLMAGAPVVIEGAERLFPTQPLMIQNTASASAPAATAPASSATSSK